MIFLPPHAARNAQQRNVRLGISNWQAQIALLTQQIEGIKQRLQQHLDQSPTLKRQRDLLEGISGIGALTASKLLAQYRDMRQFENVRQVVAFAGLNPSTASRALLFAAQATSFSCSGVS